MTMHNTLEGEKKNNIMEKKTNKGIIQVLTSGIWFPVPTEQDVTFVKSADFLER